MASGIFVILDDITVLLKQVAVMSKVATKNTAGILGDDLAVNAEKATGFSSSRELAVIWDICKGSLVNKIIILPVIFLISSFLPWLIVPILLLGGVYLCFEGAEKTYEFLGGHQGFEQKISELDSDEVADLEQEKIKSAIRTDFILSIEIVVVALWSVLGQQLIIQIIAVSITALIATFGVYGLVAFLVRMDDVGLYLQERSQLREGLFSSLQWHTGRFLVSLLPYVVKGLSVIGCIAMFAVGGGMFVHNIEFIHHYTEFIPSIIAGTFVGLLIGVLSFIVFELSSYLHKKFTKGSSDRAKN
ncbi:MAG: DUF808 domain-containing protein [Desulfotalea sp.]